MLIVAFLGNWWEIFSQSLEHRPSSIYDVLDRSATNTVPDQSKAKPKKKTKQNTVSVKSNCFVTFSVIGGKQWNMPWPIFHFLHRCRKPHNPSKKTYLSVSMRIFESWINMLQKIVIFISVAEIISVCFAVFVTCYQCRNTPLHETV